MYGVNASVPKTLIRHIVASVADETESSALRQVHSLDILDTPVSPELLPAENGKISQQTEEIVGPYDTARLLPLLCRALGVLPGKGLLSGPTGFCRRIHKCRAAEMAAEFLPAFFLPAVQTQLPAGRSQGGFRNIVAARRLAHAQRRQRRAVGGAGRCAGGIMLHSKQLLLFARPRHFPYFTLFATAIKNEKKV